MERKENQKSVEVRVDGVLVRGIISSDYRKLKIFLAGEEGSISAGEIDLSTDVPVYRLAGHDISLSGEPELRPKLAGANLWFDFLEKVALQLPEPYRGRLEWARAALISLLLKEGNTG